MKTRSELLARAREEQARLASFRQEAPLPSEVRYVGGADVSCSLWGRTFCGAVAVCDARAGLSVVDGAVARLEVDFPYIPGLLAFREVPALQRAFARLRVRPDVLLVDAHGTAHPRRFGSAAHLGVVLGLPTVGCAKSLLCGTFDEPGPNRGDWSPLLLEGETVGGVLRSRRGVKPVFVSPGHLADLPSSLNLVLACLGKYRLPEPLRAAHRLGNEGRRGAVEAFDDRE